MKYSRRLAVKLTPTIHLSWTLYETWENAAFSQPCAWAAIFHGMTEVPVSP